jgi:hypothetical protein
MIASVGDLRPEHQGLSAVFEMLRLSCIWEKDFRSVELVSELRLLRYCAKSRGL